MILMINEILYDLIYDLELYLMCNFGIDILGKY